MQTYYYKGVDGYEHHYATKGEADRAAAGYAKRNRVTTYVYVSHTAYDKYFGDHATGKPRVSRVTGAWGYAKSNPVRKSTPKYVVQHLSSGTICTEEMSKTDATKIARSMKGCIAIPVIKRQYKNNPDAVGAAKPAMVTVTAKNNPVITKKMVKDRAKDLGLSAVWSSDWDEWKINFKPGREGTANFTSDNEDAYNTLLAMAKGPRDHRTLNGRFKKNPATFGRSVMAQTRYAALPYATWFRNAKSAIIGKHKKSRVTRSRKPSAAKTPDHYTVSFARPYIRGGGNSRPGYEIVDNLSKKEAETFVRQAKSFGLKEVRMY